MRSEKHAREATGRRRMSMSMSMIMRYKCLVLEVSEPSK